MSISTGLDERSGPAGVPPVSESEQLYRRLLPAAWYRDGATTIIPQKYFMPRPWQSSERPGDADGISVNRALLKGEVEASRRPDTGERVPMAQFAVSDVHRIGLSVQPMPLPDDKSHAVIPELNSRDRLDAEKEKKMEEWAIALRNCARLIRPA